MEFPDRDRFLENRPALCYGNAVVWKPVNVTPVSAVALAEIIARQDIPKGLFSLLMGRGARLDRAQDGYYMSPGVFVNSTNAYHEDFRETVLNF